MLDIASIKKEIQSVSTSQELELVEIKYLGRSGEVNKLAKSVKSLTPDKRKGFGIELNKIKSELEHLVATKKSELFAIRDSLLADFDTSLPGTKFPLGHLHPTSLVIRDIYEYFTYLGYSVYEGPEIETDEYNFNKLNLPQDHPARDLQDTLYISEPEYLLRTHTSSVETRCLTTEELPIRIITPGKTYRNESSNASNNAMTRCRWNR
jgi:phenylalanyl-tRNA synthetase alpha chain